MWAWSVAARPSKCGVEQIADIGDRLANALAAVAGRVAVAQLHGLMPAGAGAGRHDGPAARAAVAMDLDLDGRLAAAVEHFAGVDVNNGRIGAVSCGRLQGTQRGVGQGQRVFPGRRPFEQQAAAQPAHRLALRLLRQVLDRAGAVDPGQQTKAAMGDAASLQFRQRRERRLRA